MIRYKPVRERAVLALMSHLTSISHANGFNFNVRHVYRKRDIPERANDPPELHLLFGKTEIDETYNTFQNKERAEVFIWFIVKDTGRGEEDLIYNLFVADLEKAVGNYTVEDTSGPIARIVDIIQTGHLPRYAGTREGLVVGRFEIEIEYVYMKGDPTIWDTDDTPVALEE